MSAPAGTRLYRFVQWEFPWVLGIEDGRYLVRDHAGEEPHHVLVVETVEPTPRRGGGLRGRRPRDAPPEPPPATPGLTRATLIEAEHVDEAAARAWMAGPHDDRLRHLNHALRAHRAATADPYVREVDERDPLVTRVGHGIGEEVAEGRWTEALELPRPRTEGTPRGRRLAALRPQERLAALLSARDAVLACEELVLRARLDLDHGRAREATLQAHLALEAAVAELPAFREQRDLGERITDLEGRREAMAVAANEAVAGGPSEATMEAVAAAVDRIEAALRARSASAVW